MLSSSAFDSSLVGFIWTLASGGTLVMPPARVEQDIEHLRSIITRQEITHTLLIPSLYRLILESSSRNELDCLKVVIVAGEACDAGLVAGHYERFPTTSLFNEYGPTEACVWSTVHLTSISDVGFVPIGRPVLNTTCYILDQRRRLLPIGAAGELYIGGANVSPGYYGQPELDVDAFFRNPFAKTSGGRLYRTGDLARFMEDGNIEFLGRVDSQLKVRGYRVETAGVENALLQHPSVREAAVVPDLATPSVEQLLELLAKLRPADRDDLLSSIDHSSK